ncbi:MAG TPA: hypothetical protein VHB79_16060 [Polyangiaceae bacterium]|nr:hypothetical protein [Polyangiaceae bacterium]
MEGPPSYRHLKSPFTKVIATRYYDGPMEGFLAHRDWPHACVFQLLDWDRETDLRVYEIARVEDLAFEDVVALLFQERLPTWPVWVLPSAARERGEQLVDECFTRARPVATITTRDLFGDITRWDAADDAPTSSGLLLIPRKQDAG